MRDACLKKLVFYILNNEGQRIFSLTKYYLLCLMLYLYWCQLLLCVDNLPYILNVQILYLIILSWDNDKNCTSRRLYIILTASPQSKSETYIWHVTICLLNLLTLCFCLYYCHVHIQRFLFPEEYLLLK